jgi:hypothetical protein
MLIEQKDAHGFREEIAGKTNFPDFSILRKIRKRETQMGLLADSGFATSPMYGGKNGHHTRQNNCLPCSGIFPKFWRQ